MEKKWKTAGYIRLSREDGDKEESDSVGNQRRLLEEYIRYRPELELKEYYIDDGFTGTNFNRPSFLRMLEDIERKEVDCVLVKDLSRFGRDYIDAGKYLERIFPASGVRFISITDNIDSRKQAYDMLLPIKNIFNEQYARDISRKVCTAMHTKQRAGEFIGAFASYGYRKSPVNHNQLVVDPYAAEIVRRIYTLYARGMGKNRIARTLNEEGIPCPSEYKRLNGEQYRNGNRLEASAYWTYSTIHKILQNELYTGNMVQGRKRQKLKGRQEQVAPEEWIVVEGTHQAIVERKLWEKVQKLQKQRTRELDLETNMSAFAGFLVCGDCGRSLVKKTWKAKESRRIKFFCGTYVRMGRAYCTPHGITLELLEQEISRELRRIFAGIAEPGELAGEKQKNEMSAGERPGGERTRLSAELERMRRMKKTIYEDYREGLVSKAEYLEYREEYERKEQLLREQLAAEEREEREPETRTQKRQRAGALAKRIKEGKLPAADREIVSELLENVRVYADGHIEFIYRGTGQAS